MYLYSTIFKLILIQVMLLIQKCRYLYSTIFKLIQVNLNRHGYNLEYLYSTIFKLILEIYLDKKFDN